MTDTKQPTERAGLAELRRLMEAATELPWKYSKELTAHSGEWLISLDAGNKGRGIGIAETRAGSGQEQANAAFIVAACNALPGLIAEVEQARRTAEYWKAGHIAANAEIERLQGLSAAGAEPASTQKEDGSCGCCTNGIVGDMSGAYATCVCACHAAAEGRV